MPNLISVTQRGPDIFEMDRALAPVRSAINSPVGQETVGGIRKAGAILKGNPLSLLLSELIFPDPFADGTMKGAIKKHGYEAAPSLVFTDSPETYMFKADPKVDAALTRQKAQMDAGVSGTFLPGSVSGMK